MFAAETIFDGWLEDFSVKQLSLYVSRTPAIADICRYARNFHAVSRTRSLVRDGQCRAAVSQAGGRSWGSTASTTEPGHAAMRKPVWLYIGLTRRSVTTG